MSFEEAERRKELFKCHRLSLSFQTFGRFPWVNFLQWFIIDQGQLWQSPILAIYSFFPDSFVTRVATWPGSGHVMAAELQWGLLGNTFLCCQRKSFFFFFFWIRPFPSYIKCTCARMWCWNCDSYFATWSYKPKDEKSVIRGFERPESASLMTFFEPLHQTWNLIFEFVRWDN